MVQRKADKTTGHRAEKQERITGMKTDYKTIQVEVLEDVAVLRLDNPPVNQLSATLRGDMAAVFKAAFAADDIKALVLTGTGASFVAGADITEIGNARDKAELRERVLAFDVFYNGIELGPKPVVAAINGPALGGGLELAMACHYRVAAQGVKLGQPEVQLGLIPGAGGTQRLPRLVGLPEALQMITTGVPITAEAGLEKGIVDAVVPAAALLETAVAAARRFTAGSMDHRSRMTRSRTDRLPDDVEKQQIIAFAKTTANKKARGLPAPLKAIEAMERGLGKDFDADIRMEADLFAECAVSDIAKNLIGIFLNSRSAGRLPRIKGVTPAKINTVAMLGLGVMGSGIANLLLRNGFQAILWDMDEPAVERGRQALRKTFAYPLKKGRMSEADLDRLLTEKARFTTRLEDVTAADLVIEAVLEKMAVKKEIWQKIDRICGPETLFATNTSALPITEMATVLNNPGRMMGLHFFNPAERMQLLEVVNARATTDQTLAGAVAFARKIKKIPVVVNDGPGFYVSRQLNAFMGECNFMLAEGIPLALIDRALVDFGMPMGPFALNDLTGIDIGYHVARHFESVFGERWRVSELHHRIFETGCYGRKTGAGYYDYRQGKPGPNTEVMAVVDAYLKEHRVTPRQPDCGQLANRMLARAINEAAHMLQEGICDRPRDMDLAMVYGCGYPAWRGGVLRDADAWGIDKVVRYLKELEATYGERFKPADRLEKMAAAGERFYAE